MTFQSLLGFEVGETCWMKSDLYGISFMKSKIMQVHDNGNYRIKVNGTSEFPVHGSVLFKEDDKAGIVAEYDEAIAKLKIERRLFANRLNNTS